MKKIRCAIYTRKSSEEGLDQDFNSLDAQREACEAYVASQKHEGWVALPERYDDGGVSGGTLDRSGLQRLLQAIDDGLVDQIIVYKIDRLTRSLMDFSKLIERLDAADASFVSVTQSFNTATSMGRLTLNVLLSFAQFEREVTAERIRDKIAASKKKGMWMGGPVPLGYRVQDRQLIIKDDEASAVRQIYDLYLALGTVRALKQEVDRLGMISRHWVTRAGEQRGGKPYTRGHLYRILTNPLYVGKVSHKGQTYDGQHQGIVQCDVWDRVQTRLTSSAAKPRNQNSITYGSIGRQTQVSALAGKLFDETRDRLTPSHANKKGRRYRYYVSNRLVRRSGEAGATGNTVGGWRLPARPLEETITNIITDRLSDDRWVRDLSVVSQQAADAIHAIKHGAARLLVRIAQAQSPIELVAPLIDKIIIADGHITIRLDRAVLLSALGFKEPKGSSNQQAEPEPLIIKTPFDHRKRGVESKLVLGQNQSALLDPVLITNIANARQWLDKIKNGISVSQIAKEQNRSIRQIQRHIELAFLSPKIILLITEGSQPPELTSRHLLNTPIPMDWDEQHHLFGIS